MDDTPRVCLERTVELETARLRLRDWPGFDGPLVVLPDPLVSDSRVAVPLAAAATPRWRVVCLEPRGDAPYQVHVGDVVGLLDQFGFEQPTLVAERLACVTALLGAAWYPNRAARLVLLDQTYAPPADSGETLFARSLRDCPPDWSNVRGRIDCPVLEVAHNKAAVQRIIAFVSAR